jgi:hypothetical protein
VQPPHSVGCRCWALRTSISFWVMSSHSIKRHTTQKALNREQQSLDVINSAPLVLYKASHEMNVSKTRSDEHKPSECPSRCFRTDPRSGGSTRSQTGPLVRCTDTKWGT